MSNNLRGFFRAYPPTLGTPMSEWGDTIQREEERNAHEQHGSVKPQTVGMRSSAVVLLTIYGLRLQDTGGTAKGRRCKYN